MNRPMGALPGMAAAADPDNPNNPLVLTRAQERALRVALVSPDEATALDMELLNTLLARMNKRAESWTRLVLGT